MTVHIVDTGPIVAFLNARDEHHDWAKKVFSDVVVPGITSESVISESCFLLRNVQGGQEAVLELIRRKILVVQFSLQQEIHRVLKLRKKYASTPMSLADASLVRISEITPNSSVITLDSDFLIYRKNGKSTIPTIMPDQQS